MTKDKFFDNVLKDFDKTDVGNDIIDVIEVEKGVYDCYFPNAATSEISVKKGKEFLRKLDFLEINNKYLRVYFWNLEPFGIEDREDVGIILTFEIKKNIKDEDYNKFYIDIVNLINKYYELIYQYGLY